MQFNWALKRKIITLSIVFGFLLSVGLIIYFMMKPDPTCFDEMKNQNENGIDCGGVCALQCSTDTTPLQTLWTKSFQVRPFVYDIAALVENINTHAGVREFTYTVDLFDAAGRNILKETKSTFANAGDHFLLFFGGLQTHGVPAADARLTIQPKYSFVRSSLPAEKKVRVVEYTLLSPDEKPRLVAVIQNETTQTFTRMPVTVAISDKTGPIAVSETIIERLDPRSTYTAVFTWPAPLKYLTTQEACAAPTDVVVVMDRSGSMRSDGDEPPQPLTLAKDAARSFITQLASTDQVGYVSFATNASSPIDHVLSKDFGSIDMAVENTAIATSGLQYTNIAEALGAALLELRSSRARKDAKPAIVFLTDGDPTYPKNPEDGGDVEYPKTQAMAAAQNIKDAGISLYVIGLGDEVKTEYLSTLASFPEYYYGAATGEDLSRIYGEIATTICKKGAPVVEIIPRLNEVGTD
jgi:hypothetical protein